MLKVKKEVTKYEDHNIDLIDVTLLSIEEYDQYRKIIPLVNFCWWLRSPGNSQYNAPFVHSGGTQHYYYVGYSSIYVRPVLICKPTGLTAGIKLKILGMLWTVLNESLILCDENIGHSAFREDSDASDANVYEASDVKKFIQNWRMKEIVNNG